MGPALTQRGSEMPLVRYFLFMGAVLLGLLFWSDWYFPKPIIEASASDIDRSIIRIHSSRVWPAAVTLDTSAPVPQIAPSAIAEAGIAAPAKSLKEAYAYAPPPAVKTPDRVRRRARTTSRLSTSEPRPRFASYQSNWFSGAR